MYFWYLKSFSDIWLTEVSKERVTCKLEPLYKVSTASWVILSKTSQTHVVKYSYSSDVGVLLPPDKFQYWHVWPPAHTKIGGHRASLLMFVSRESCVPHVQLIWGWLISGCRIRRGRQHRTITASSCVFISDCQTKTFHFLSVYRLKSTIFSHNLLCFLSQNQHTRLRVRTHTHTHLYCIVFTWWTDEVSQQTHIQKLVFSPPYVQNWPHSASVMLQFTNDFFISGAPQRRTKYSTLETFKGATIFFFLFIVFFKLLSP